MSSRNLALRRNDQQSAETINEQIRALGGDPATGDLLAADDQVSEYDARVMKINENNRRKTKESQKTAHQLAAERKRAEDAVVRSRA
jgi:RNA polymerase-associated protein RTF1